MRNDRELNKHMFVGMKRPDLEQSLSSDALFTLIAGMVKSLDLRARGDGLGCIGVNDAFQGLLRRGSRLHVRQS